MRRVAENRSLDRGLEILDSLSLHGASSLRDLHIRTGLPKSTIRRLLGTLVRRKVVRRSLSDRRYRANIALPMRGKAEIAPREGWLVDCAVPHMIELTRSVGWSCDLHIFERRCSRVIESTRPLSPFYQYERPIDLEVSVFASAGGLAALATLPEATVLALADEIGEDPVWGLARVGMTPHDLLVVLRHIRIQGYAVRVSQYRWENALANKLNAMGRALLHHDAPVGALVILWPREFLAPERFAEIHLAGLKEAAARISADLARIDRAPPRADVAGTWAPSPAAPAET